MKNRKERQDDLVNAHYDTAHITTNYNNTA